MFNKSQNKTYSYNCNILFTMRYGITDYVAPDAFYLRQLWLFNLGIHLISKGKSEAHFRIWTEGDGGRGCSEVASCLLSFLDTSGIPNGSHLCAWSDSCAGQNKNYYIISFWQYVIRSGKCSVIDHKFPESGHSFLHSDRDFAQIEKKGQKRWKCLFC